MRSAYGVEGFQISGPAWFDSDSDHFDVSANLAANTTRAEFRIMLQNLLAERFHVALHHETRDFPVFELVIAKSGIKFKETTPGSAPLEKPGFPSLAKGRPDYQVASDGNGRSRMNAHDEEIYKLAGAILSTAGRLGIIDKTGLTGKYDWTLEYDSSVIPDPTYPDAGPQLNTALEQQLGLKLVDAKKTYEIVVIDRADKEPTEN